MYVNVRNVGVGRVGVCILCLGNIEQRERGICTGVVGVNVVYYESIKREVKTKPIKKSCLL